MDMLWILGPGLALRVILLLSLHKAVLVMSVQIENRFPNHGMILTAEEWYPPWRIMRNLTKRTLP